MDYIVHGFKVWLCCVKLTYFGSQHLKRVMFRLTSVDLGLALVSCDMAHNLAE
jgi:hypothetical protein